MADFHLDQAAGLRRLMGSHALQVVSFISASKAMGRTTIVSNLAAALSRRGKNVLVIDENTGTHGVSAAFGQKSTHDLLHVLTGEMPLDRVLLQPMPGLRILLSAKATQKLGRLSESQQKVLCDEMGHLQQAPDIILIDANVSHPQGFSPFGLAAQEIVVVVSPHAVAVSGAYALIKKVSTHFSRRHFRLLVNKIRNPAEGLFVFDHMAEVTATRQIATLQYVGGIMQDEMLSSSRQSALPLVLRSPEAPATLNFHHLVSSLLCWPEQVMEGGKVGGVEQFMQALLDFSQKNIAVGASMPLECLRV